MWLVGPQPRRSELLPAQRHRLCLELLCLRPTLCAPLASDDLSTALLS